MSIHKRRYKRQQAAISRNIKLKSRSHGVRRRGGILMERSMSFTEAKMLRHDCELRAKRWDMKVIHADENKYFLFPIRRVFMTLDEIRVFFDGYEYAMSRRPIW